MPATQTERILARHSERIQPASMSGRGTPQTREFNIWSHTDLLFLKQLLGNKFYRRELAFRMGQRRGGYLRSWTIHRGTLSCSYFETLEQVRVEGQMNCVFRLVVRWTIQFGFLQEMGQTPVQRANASKVVTDVTRFYEKRRKIKKRLSLWKRKERIWLWTYLIGQTCRVARCRNGSDFVFCWMKTSGWMTPRILHWRHAFCINVTHLRRHFSLANEVSLHIRVTNYIMWHFFFIIAARLSAPGTNCMKGYITIYVSNQV